MKRYTKKFYKENNVTMFKMASGTKVKCIFGNIDKSKDIIPNLVANHLGINRFGKGETKWNYL